MTQGESQFVPCPHCQEETAVEVTNVLREGQQEVQDLLAGALNRMTCEHCRETFLFETPLIYRDDEEHYLVYYTPRSLVPSLDTALSSMETLYEQIFAELGEDDRPTCRLTLQRNQFIEKITLHQNELDDRIIEYIKYLLFQHNTGLDPVRHELLFDFGHIDGETIQFLAYGREDGKPEYSLGFAVNDYYEIEEQLFGTPEMEAELGRMYRQYYVSVEALLT